MRFGLRKMHGSARAAVLLLALTLAPRDAAAQARLSPAAAWIGAGALVAGAALLDEPLTRDVPMGGGTRLHWATRQLNHGGNPKYAAIGLGATYLGARAARAPALARATEHVAIALVASGAVAGALKTAVGRERPSFTTENDRFRPINLADRFQSFPSGHATVAFSLAASISDEARVPAVTVATYTTAALVGWSRVYDRRHWPSDVVAGALIGVGTSRFVVHHLHRSAEVTVAPLPGGIAISIPR